MSNILRQQWESVSFMIDMLYFLNMNEPILLIPESHMDADLTHLPFG
jgi:hypothetical protein